MHAPFSHLTRVGPFLSPAFVHRGLHELSRAL
jgi:hypothetical protein